MSKTQKPTAPTKAGSKAATQPSMWAQLEEFMKKANLNTLSIDRQEGKKGTVFSIDINIADEEYNDEIAFNGSSAEHSNVEDCIIDLTLKMSEKADNCLTFVNAIKL